MELVYKPADGDEQRWEVDLGKFRSMEAEAIERHTGLDYGTDYVQALLKGNMRARRALLWTLQRRIHPVLKFVDVDFAASELQLEMNTEELTAVRETVEADDNLDDEVRTAALMQIDQQIADAESPGKAPTPSVG